MIQFSKHEQELIDRLRSEKRERELRHMIALEKNRQEQERCGLGPAPADIRIPFVTLKAGYRQKQ